MWFFFALMGTVGFWVFFFQWVRRDVHKARIPHAESHSQRGSTQWHFPIFPVIFPIFPLQFGMADKSQSSVSTTSPSLRVPGQRTNKGWAGVFFSSTAFVFLKCWGIFHSMGVLLHSLWQTDSKTTSSPRCVVLFFNKDNIFQNNY